MSPKDPLELALVGPTGVQTGGMVGPNSIAGFRQNARSFDRQAMGGNAKNMWGALAQGVAGVGSGLQGQEALKAERMMLDQRAREQQAARGRAAAQRDEQFERQKSLIELRAGLQQRAQEASRAGQIDSFKQMISVRDQVATAQGLERGSPQYNAFVLGLSAPQQTSHQLKAAQAEQAQSEGQQKLEGLLNNLGNITSPNKALRDQGLAVSPNQLEYAIGPDVSDPDSWVGSLGRTYARARHGNTPHMIRERIRGDITAIGEVMKNLTRQGGEGVFAKDDRAAIETLASSLLKANTEAEYTQTLNQIRARIGNVINRNLLGSSSEPSGANTLPPGYSIRRLD